MIKSINRFKVRGNQALGRQEKTEVLNDTLQVCEKRVDNIRHACHSTTKKLKDCIQGAGQDIEKRQKKLPYYILSQSMQECSHLFAEDSIFGLMLAHGSEACQQIALELTSHEMGLENLIILPFSVLLENDFPKIEKTRRKLTKLALDLDSSKAKHNAAAKVYQNNQSLENKSKVDALDEEMNDARIKMEQCKDQLSNEMMSIVSKEPDYARSLIDMVSAQAQYHRNALARLEVLVPKMQEVLEQHKRRPVFGTPLEEHLETEGVKIAVPLQTCVDWLLEFGITEEGLFRIAGSASKVKVLTSALNASVELPIHDFIGHEHAVAGAMKQYLRELPEPLLTFQHYEELVAAQSIKDNKEKLETLWRVFHSMPQANRDNFEFLVRFLYKVSLKSDRNKMGASNLALVIGPNIMWSATDQGISAATMGVASSILESFITNSNYFFPEASPTIEFINPVEPNPTYSKPTNSNLQNGVVPKTPEPVVNLSGSATPPPPTRPPPSAVVAPTTPTDGAKPPLTPPSQAQRLKKDLKAGTIPRRTSKKGQAPLPPALPGSAGQSPSPSPTNSLTRQEAPTPPVASTNPFDEDDEDEVVEGKDEADCAADILSTDNNQMEKHVAEKSSNDSLDRILSASEDDHAPTTEPLYAEIHKDPKTPPVKEKPPRPNFPKGKNDGPPGVPTKPLRPKPPSKIEKKPNAAEKKDGGGSGGSLHRPHKPPPVPKNPPRREDMPANRGSRSGSESASVTSPPPPLSPPATPKDSSRSPAAHRPKMVPPPPPDLDGENTHL